MKIISISWLNNAFFGGVERRAHEFSIVANNYHEVSFYAIKTPWSKKSANNDYNENDIFLPVNPYRFGLKYFWETFFLKRVTKKLKKKNHNNTIVHGQGVNGYPGVANGLPTVICMHGAENDYNRKGKIGTMWRETIDKCDHIFSISENVRERLVKIGVDAKKITTVYNGIDIKKFQNVTKTDIEKVFKKFSLNQKTKYILSVHNLINKKRTKEMLDVFLSVQEKFLDRELLICGDGYNRAVLERYSRSKKIRVRFLGRLNDKDLLPIYRLSDVFVLNSSKEGLPISIGEAMASKCALVVGNVGSIGEILKNNVNSLLNDRCDDEAFRKNLIRVLSDNVLREKISERACSDSFELSWENQFTKINKVYNDISLKKSFRTSVDG